MNLPTRKYNINVVRSLSLVIVVLIWSVAMSCPRPVVIGPILCKCRRISIAVIR